MTRLRSSTSTPTLESPFLHLKFLEGRPPDFAARHAFAHELALAPGETALPEGLRTDVQREGIARYLVNNFKVRLRSAVWCSGQGRVALTWPFPPLVVAQDGSPVHGVIHERVRDSSYIVVNSNWHRSSGDR